MSDIHTDEKWQEFSEAKKIFRKNRRLGKKSRYPVSCVNIDFST